MANRGDKQTSEQETHAAELLRLVRAWQAAREEHSAISAEMLAAGRRMDAAEDALDAYLDAGTTA